MAYTAVQTERRVRGNHPVHYVYEHWRPDTNVCFYIGKGKGRRAYRQTNRNRRWFAVVAKLHRLGLEVEVRIVIGNLTSEQAIRFEIDHIAKARPHDLVNMTPGGEGRAGYVVSLETRNKIREKLKGRKLSAERCANIAAGLTGRTMSPEACANMSRARKGVKTGRPLTEAQRLLLDRRGKPISPEGRLNMSRAQKGKKMGPPSALHRAKIAAKTRAAWADPETRARFLAARRKNK